MTPIVWQGGSGQGPTSVGRLTPPESRQPHHATRTAVRNATATHLVPRGCRLTLVRLVTDVGGPMVEAHHLADVLDERLDCPLAPDRAFPACFSSQSFNAAAGYSVLPSISAPTTSTVTSMTALRRWPPGTQTEPCLLSDRTKGSRTLRSGDDRRSGAQRRTAHLRPGCGRPPRSATPLHLDVHGATCRTAARRRSPGRSGHPGWSSRRPRGRCGRAR